MTRKDRSMTVPQPGEIEAALEYEPAPYDNPAVLHRHMVTLFRAMQARERAARVDPPAPEPNEAEKVDAEVAANLCSATGHNFAHCRAILDLTREWYVKAGYVLAPTSGPGFEAMVDDGFSVMPWDERSVDAVGGKAKVARILRAALERCKETGR